MAVDEANDRLIIFGGSGNDTWALPLSGPNMNVWKQLDVSGTAPPDAAGVLVYDPHGQRTLLLAASGSEGSRLWQLPSQDPAVWSPLVSTGEVPTDGYGMALDADENRLFVIGSAVWSVSLDGPARWTRVADLPSKYGISYDSVLVVDRESRRLLVSNLDYGLWSFSLDTYTWARLAASGEPDGADVFDAPHHRFLTYGGEDDRIAITSLASGQPTYSSAYVSAEGAFFGTGTVDVKRHRALYFGGLTNAVSSIDLDTLEWSEVKAATRTFQFGVGSPTFVWDPVRSLMVALDGTKTWSRGLVQPQDWSLLVDQQNLDQSLASAVYDIADRQVVSFGLYLPSPLKLGTDARRWEEIVAEPGPGPRFGRVAVYDATHNRMLVHGGFRNSGGDDIAFDDVWALDLSVGAWVPLAPQGPAPPARGQHAGIYDPVGQRLIIYGGWSSDGIERGYLTDLWSLDLSDAPAWTELSPAGEGPPARGWNQPSAVYDLAGRRMILVTSSTEGAIRMFALELEGAPTWHEFCAPGIVPFSSGTISTITNGAGNAISTNDGLVLTTNGASFRFNLATPYCDAPGGS